jgi:hypothetical protein
MDKSMRSTVDIVLSLEEMVHLWIYSIEIGHLDVGTDHLRRLVCVGLFREMP